MNQLHYLASRVAQINLYVQSNGHFCWLEHKIELERDVRMRSAARVCTTHAKIIILLLLLCVCVCARCENAMKFSKNHCMGSLKLKN